MDTSTSPSASNAPLNLRAGAPRWIWAVVAAVLALIVGLATGMAVKSRAPDPGVQAQTGELAISPSAGPLDPRAVARGEQTPLAEAPRAAPAERQASTTRHRNRHDTVVAKADESVAYRAPEPVSRTAICETCGVVESVTPIKRRGEGSGMGAVAGGVVGGLLGNQMGKGSGNAAMTVLGAVGGGFAGNAVEKEVRAYTVYQTRVRMEDGSVRTFDRQSALNVGTRVHVDGSTLRVD